MFSVECYGFATCFEEDVVRYRGDGDETGGMRHACAIFVGAEYGDGIVTGHSEGFDTLKGLLPVIQCGSHAVDSEVGILNERGFGPLSRFNTVVGLDMAVDCVWYDVRNWVIQSP